MADLASDRDRIVVYQETTKNILAGWHYDATKPQKPHARIENGAEVDEQYMEIGHLINLLVRGNINAIWAVISPVIIIDSPILAELRALAYEEMSKVSTASIRGMAKAQALDNEKRRRLTVNNKGLRTAIRTLRFGITMMEEHKFAFEPVPYLDADRAKRVYVDTMERFEESSGLMPGPRTTTLPERPDEKKFRDFLLRLRVEDIVREDV